MLSQITWSSYWIAVILLLVFYYLVIGLLYYRNDLSNSMKRHLESRTRAEDEQEEEEPSSQESFKELESIVANIKGTLEKAGKEANKEELLQSFGEILASYEGLEVPAFRVAINNYIIGHAEKSCAITFREEELNQYWQQIRS